LQKQEIDSMKPLEQSSEMQVMNTLLKQRRESAELFRKGGREEMAAKEEAEIGILETYMPAEATEGDLDQAITAAMGETGATTSKQMGAVMKAAQARLAGKRVDGRRLSELVKQRLG
ncbi:MAG: GatB/YqeY domain-containing protein, partial [Acidobacteriaceae bacterium]|nr:GatB/YqeY domain-containing protein [Acidobacteriaceae bacterium]